MTNDELAGNIARALDIVHNGFSVRIDGGNPTTDIDAIIAAVKAGNEVLREPAFSDGPLGWPRDSMPSWPVGLS